MTHRFEDDAAAGWPARAQALADSGRLEEACRLARAALDDRRAAERAQAEQAARDWAARHDADDLRRERERQQDAAAAAESQRAVQADLQATLLRIEQLGRQIGAEHDLRAVLQRIDEGVAAVLPAPRRATWLLDPAGEALRRAAGHDGPRPLRRTRVSLQAPGSAVALCARLGRAVVVDGTQTVGPEPPPTAGTVTTLLWPLKAEHRLVGVLEVAVPGQLVPDLRQRSVMASFCAFAAVALANARTWAALSHSRSRLAASERAAQRARRAAAQVWARQAGAMQRLATALGAPLARLGAALADLDDVASPGTALDHALARHAEASATACEALDLTRLQAGGVVLEPEVFALDDLLADAVAAFAHRRPGLRLRCVPAGPQARVRADVAALDRTLATLLEALAARAAPGEALHVQASCDPEHVHLQLSIDSPGGTATVDRPPPGEWLRLRLAVARELLALQGTPLHTLQREAPAYALRLERVA